MGLASRPNESEKSALVSQLAPDRPTREAPESNHQSALRAVDLAIADLRRGGLVLIEERAGSRVLALAAEATTPTALARLAEFAEARPRIAVTARRAATLGLRTADTGTVVLTPATHLCAQTVLDITDPIADAGRLEAEFAAAQAAAGGTCEDAAVALAKLARLLPAVLFAPVSRTSNLPSGTERAGVLTVGVEEIASYTETAARTLHPVAEASVPLAGAPDTRIVAFRPADGGIEHLAILIGSPEPTRPALARLHSECFTGDILGSLRCDCGDQLRGAIDAIAEEGSGVLLYLAQEGRGIGLVNKLRAYALQGQGFDTLDANEQLGFDADERFYLQAAKMLRQLGFLRVRLLTNNPAKVRALERCGIEVAERVPHAFPSNGHNERYLDTKAKRFGHIF